MSTKSRQKETLFLKGMFDFDSRENNAYFLCSVIHKLFFLYCHMSRSFFYDNDSEHIYSTLQWLGITLKLKVIRPDIFFINLAGGIWPSFSKLYSMGYVSSQTKWPHKTGCAYRCDVLIDLWRTFTYLTHLV